MDGRRARTVVLAALTLLALLLAACGSSSDDANDDGGDGNGQSGVESVIVEPTGDPEAGGSLVFGLGAETNNWNPSTSQWGASGYNVANAIFDRLMAYNQINEPEPYLCEDLVHNDDFTEWTMTLRDGPTFHDGTPVDADAIKANIDNLKEAALTKSGARPIESTRVTGPNELVISMNTPWATFPHLLTFQPGYVMAPSMITDPDGSTNPVGSGPFVFKEWVPDNHLTVEKNPDYWREGYPLLEEIDFRVITDTTSRGQALENGDVDIIESSEPGQILSLNDKAHAGDLQEFIDLEGDGSEIFVALNTAKPPFDNLLARQAVAYALDKEQISESVYEGLFTPADSPFEPGSEWYTEVDAPHHDTAKAAELAQQYEDETGEKLSFTLNVTPDPQVVQVAELGQQQMADAGIDMDINRIEQTQLLIDALGGEFEATGFILFNSPHLDRDSVFIHSDNVAPIGETALAFTRMVNPKIDEALDAARASNVRTEQIEYYATVQEEMAKDLAFVFVVHNEAGLFAANSVRDVTNWTFPGTDHPGLGQEGAVVMSYQIWIET